MTVLPVNALLRDFETNGGSTVHDSVDRTPPGLRDAPADRPAVLARAEQAGGRGRQDLDRPDEVEVPGRDQLGHRDGERGLEPDRPVRRAIELGFLLLHGVRSMVRGDASIVPSASPARRASRSSAERNGGFTFRFVS